MPASLLAVRASRFPPTLPERLMILPSRPMREPETLVGTVAIVGARGPAAPWRLDAMGQWVGHPARAAKPPLDSGTVAGATWAPWPAQAPPSPAPDPSAARSAPAH